MRQTHGQTLGQTNTNFYKYEMKRLRITKINSIYVLQHVWSPNFHLLCVYCLINKYVHFDISICQMWLQVMDLLSLDLIVVFGYLHILLKTIHVWSVVSPPNFNKLCDQWNTHLFYQMLGPSIYYVTQFFDFFDSLFHSVKITG